MPADLDLSHERLDELAAALRDAWMNRSFPSLSPDDCRLLLRVVDLAHRGLEAVPAGA